MFQHDLGSALRASAQTHRDRPALWANGERSTYGELFDRAARIAAGLRASGLRPGDRVAILSHRTTTAYAGILGCLLAGLPFVALNTKFPAERNGVILRASGARAMILGLGAAVKLDELLDRIGDDVVIITPEAGAATVHRGARQIRSEDLPAASLDSLNFADEIDPDSPAYLVFTSGSTGAPKGVVTSHANVAAYIAGVMEIAPHGTEDRVLQLADLTFDPSVHDMCLAWLNGGELYSMPENSAILAPRLIAQHNITSLYIVPSVAARSMQNGLVKPGRMTSMKYTFFCGEPLPETVARQWSEGAPNCAVYNFYGPTEGTVSFSYFLYEPKAEPEFVVVPIGIPFSDQKMAAFDPDLKPVAPGENGELFLAGSQVMKGYWNAPQLNAEKFATVDGVRWYRSGDVARWVEPYGFVFAGRIDRQVKIRGYRTELQEIEGVLRRVSGQQEVGVLPWPVNPQGAFEGTVGFIAGLDGEADPELEERLRSACRAMVADYMVPDRILFMESLPVNSNGKIDYKELAQHPALHEEVETV